MKTPTVRPTRLLLCAATGLALAAGAGSPALAEPSATATAVPAHAAQASAAGGVEVAEGQTVTSVATSTIGSQVVRVSTTESVTRDHATETRQLTAPPAAAAAARVRCWQHGYRLVGKSLAGVTLFRWRHVVRWCFKGGKPYKVTADRGINDGTFLLWKYVGSKTVDTNKTRTFFYREKQGHYKLCSGPTGCVQHRYPTHGARYFNGGRVVTLVAHT